MDEQNKAFVLEHLRLARFILAECHDVVDTDSPLVQAPNWAMHATNAIDEALEIVEQQK